MLTSKECCQIWQEIKEIYRNTIDQAKTPRYTMDCIIEKFGRERAEEVFATVCAIKKHDGRIYGQNREYMDSIAVNPESIQSKSGNSMVYAGLDDIHTTHINQLITVLREGRVE